MWSPTHVQVLVKRAKGLNLKGKNGTNDAFVTIAMAKEKFQTSVKEKSTENVEWCEQCELTIPQQGNKAEIVLTALHRNFLGVDEFLGQVSIPLRDFDVYEKPKSKWYPLKCKPGQTKTDYRGELEVRTSFTVKSTSGKDNLGSTQDLASSKKNKDKGSLTSLKGKSSKMGGSLMNLPSKDSKSLKDTAKNVSHKLKFGSKSNLGTIEEKEQKKLEKEQRKAEKEQRKLEKKLKKSKGESGSSATLPSKFDLDSSFGAASTNDMFAKMGENSRKNRDPGVQSDEDDDDDMFKLDAISHRSSGSSLAINNSNRDGLYRQSFGTPVNPRRSNPDVNSIGSTGTPKSSRSFNVDNATKKPQNDNNVLDEWEAKLLGKKDPVPYKGGHNNNNLDDTNSASFSIGSRNSSFSERTPKTTFNSQQPNLSPPQETPTGRKKLIPVGSDFDTSSPDHSPESQPGSGGVTLRKKTPSFTAVSNQQAIENSRNSALSFGGSLEALHENERQKQKKKSSTLGMKLKNSYKSCLGGSLGNLSRSGSLFNLPGGGAKGRESNESLQFGQHSRNHSDASQLSSRVVPGRESTPTGHHQQQHHHQQQQHQQQPNRIPRELWDKFEGKSREDLIEVIVKLQSTCEQQAKKTADLEDYIDSLLTKVIVNAPHLLQKNNGYMDNNKFSKMIK